MVKFRELQTEGVLCQTEKYSKPDGSGLILDSEL